MSTLQREVTISGVTLVAVYKVLGCYMAATDVDPVEKPVVTLVGLEIAGEDITRIVSDTVCERIEEIIQNEEYP